MRWRSTRSAHASAATTTNHGTYTSATPTPTSPASSPPKPSSAWPYWCQPWDPLDSVAAPPTTATPPTSTPPPTTHGDTAPPDAQPEPTSRPTADAPAEQPYVDAAITIPPGGVLRQQGDRRRQIEPGTNPQTPSGWRSQRFRPE